MGVQIRKIFIIIIKIIIGTFGIGYSETDTKEEDNNADFAESSNEEK